MHWGHEAASEGSGYRRMHRVCPRRTGGLRDLLRHREGEARSGNPSVGAEQAEMLAAGATSRAPASCQDLRTFVKKATSAGSEGVSAPTREGSFMLRRPLTETQWRHE